VSDAAVAMPAAASGVDEEPAVQLRPIRRGVGGDARRRRAYHRRALGHLVRQGIPFLVGGGYALRHYAPGVRGTIDLDLFVRRRHARPTLRALGALGLETDLTFPHWLGKARLGADAIDIIYSSGNGLAAVDDGWFAHAVPATVLGVKVALCPPEEMIWSKAFVMERERYDGADVAHILRACHATLDWRRLVHRFGRNWRVLLSHLILFGFVYPDERASVPWELMSVLGHRLGEESRQAPLAEGVCQGTLLSRAQYLTDVLEWGYTDGRLGPHASMTADDVARWTAAIEPDPAKDDAAGRRR
jgi:hypothetical protein